MHRGAPFRWTLQSSWQCQAYSHRGAQRSIRSSTHRSDGVDGQAGKGALRQVGQRQGQQRTEGHAEVGGTDKGWIVVCKCARQVGGSWGRKRAGTVQAGTMQHAKAARKPPKPSIPTGRRHCPLRLSYKICIQGSKGRAAGGTAAELMKVLCSSCQSTPRALPGRTHLLCIAGWRCARCPGR